MAPNTEKEKEETHTPQREKEIVRELTREAQEICLNVLGIPSHLPVRLSLGAMVDATKREDMAKVPMLTTTSKAAPSTKTKNPNGRVAEEVEKKEADGKQDQSGSQSSTTPKLGGVPNNDLRQMEKEQNPGRDLYSDNEKTFRQLKSLPRALVDALRRGPWIKMGEVDIMTLRGACDFRSIRRYGARRATLGNSRRSPRTNRSHKMRMAFRSIHDPFTE